MSYTTRPQVTSQTISFATAIDRLSRILKYKLELEPRDERQSYYLNLDCSNLELALTYLQSAREAEGVTAQAEQ